VPLSEVWSTLQRNRFISDDQTTRYIGDLEKGSLRNKTSLGEIKSKLNFRSLDRAKPAFAVEGTGLEALTNAHTVIVGNKPAPLEISHNKDVSIVFSALGSPYYVALTSISREGTKLLIRYELIPRPEKDMPTYLALIPIGRLSPGFYRVQIDHETYEKRFRAAGLSGPNEHMLGRVSTSFAFTVK
jgi:hypothetical protein